jgi:hypothetical protein
MTVITSPGQKKAQARKRQSTAELIQREQEARLEAERAAAAIVARYEDDDALVGACGKLLDVFAPSCLKIRTKQGGPLWPFVLNWIQVDYLTGLRELFTGGKGDFFRGIRDLIVKPRQLGFSTFIAALFFMDGLLEPGRISVIVTHDDKISKELLRTYKLFYDELPDELKKGTRLRTAAANVYEIEFDGVPEVSRFEIRTEKGTEWRGGVIHNLHASEAAFYEHWADFMASYVQAVPASGNIIFETTCNGRNEFYEEVVLAMDGANGYRVIFYEWFKHPEYKRPWHPDEQEPLTKVEQDLVAAHGLTLEQIAWRRWKITEVKDKFQQEYPETLLGAFLATGRPFFDPLAVDKGHERAKAAVLGFEDGSREKPRHPRAYVTVYEDPIPGELYILSADIAEGIDKGSGDGEKGGADFNSAAMLKVSNLKVVADIHGRMPVVEFAEILNRLGRLYQAVLAPERNNHGHTVVASLQRAEYPELYHHAEYNEEGKRFLKAGWPTNVVTRPQMLDALDTVIRRGALHYDNPAFWREADRFVRNEKTGKPEAMASWHDDRIIALAIAVYLATLGRTAWGLEANPSRDASGFPRTPESYGKVSTPPLDKRVAEIIEGGHRKMAKAGMPVPPPPPKTSLADMRKAHAEAKFEPPPRPVEAPANPFNPAPAGMPTVPSVLKTSNTAGSRVLEALAELKDKKSRRCLDCLHRSDTGSGQWCAFLRMRILDSDPACDRFTLPESDDEDGMLESDFGGESWT